MGLSLTKLTIVLLCVDFLVQIFWKSFVIQKNWNLINTNSQISSDSTCRNFRLLTNRKKWAFPQYGNHKLNVDASHIEGCEKRRCYQK